MQLTTAARTALRSAIRAHPAAATVLDGKPVNRMTKPELLGLASLLRIDVAAIVAATADAPAAPRPAPTGSAALRPWSPVHAPIADAPAAPTLAHQTDTAAPSAVTEAPPDYTAQAADVRRALGRALAEGDFDDVTTQIAELLARANRPAEVRTETVYLDAPAGSAPAPAAPRGPVPVPAAVGSATWASLFHVRGALGNRKALLYSASATTPAQDPKYRWPDPATGIALSALARGRNVWFYGPAGTGKTTFVEQLAAKTGRPFYLISCDDTTEAPELIGMTVPAGGGTRWQDGVLTAAIRTPHAVILIDEPTVARSGALMVLQSVLASRVLSIKETGEVVRVATGVTFIVADNTNGTGGGSAEGYEGTRRMNAAFLNRFGAFIKLDYMAPDEEAAALVAHTACTPQLAAVLVECAGLTRKARVTHALGLRRLIAWAELLTDGVAPRAAFEVAALNSASRDDREPVEQCCALGLDRRKVAEALAGVTPATPAPTPAPGTPAADFVS